MPDFTSASQSTVFAKTAQGQQEILGRALGLPVLARRILVLVDGHRSGRDLAAFVPDGSLESCLSALLEQHCIEAVAAVARPAAAPSKKSASPADSLNTLPLAETRSAQELEKARNFMTNTVNNIFGHHNRISLIESIYACQSSDQLRQVYPAWVNALAGSSSGKKRLPELSEKLFTVL